MLRGEAVLVIEGQERPLRAWDFAHCPGGTQHVIVGAGDEPCVLLCVGARDRSTGPEWGAYTVDEAALRRGAGVERETTEPREAYARFPPGKLTRYRDGWLGVGAARAGGLRPARAPATCRASASSRASHSTPTRSIHAVASRSGAGSGR